MIGYASIQDFYDFGDVIGRGKFGAVKTAVHKKTGKKVAIKILKKKEMNIREIEMQKNEIEILKVCQHPNIIRLLDIFENQDHQYIGKKELMRILVMEYLEGGDLFAFLEKRDFRVSE